MKKELSKQVTINNFTFELDKKNMFYQCRGQVMYDNEHDEIPQPELWSTAIKLEKHLEKEGYESEASYSEKGWVEVNILNM